MLVDGLKGVDNRMVKQKGLHQLGGFGAAKELDLKKTDIERAVKTMLTRRQVVRWSGRQDVR
eukprot:4391710-Prymnesium_polylepis.2